MEVINSYIVMNSMIIIYLLYFEESITIIKVKWNKILNRIFKKGANFIKQSLNQIYGKT
jgi:hypothetical protein